MTRPKMALDMALVDANPKSIQRFQRYLNGESPDECWVWAGPKRADGYGIASVGGREFRAHRVSFLIHNGHLPELIRHTCDNPPCCNPAHLLAGTSAENSRDMVDRGRASHCMTSRGEDKWGAKLTVHTPVKGESR